MTYAGPARSAIELHKAIHLAATVFQSKGGAIDDELKRLRTSGLPHFKSDDVYRRRERGGVAAALVLADRHLAMDGVPVPATYFTSVCVDPQPRKQGLSRPLMASAREACERRGAAAMLLIARRAVDGYYNKFGLWGVSSYSRVNIATPALDNATSLREATDADLSFCAMLYEQLRSEIGQARAIIAALGIYASLATTAKLVSSIVGGWLYYWFWLDNLRVGGRP